MSVNSCRLSSLLSSDVAPIVTAIVCYRFPLGVSSLSRYIGLCVVRCLTNLSLLNTTSENYERGESIRIL